MELHALFAGHEIRLDDCGVLPAIADVEFKSEISLESLFSGVNLSSGIYVEMYVLFEKPQVSGDPSADRVGA